MGETTKRFFSLLPEKRKKKVFFDEAEATFSNFECLSAGGGEKSFSFLEKGNTRFKRLVCILRLILFCVFAHHAFLDTHNE